MAGNNVEQIKDRLTIIDVVSSYIKLEKAGKNYKARCPFHNEKTPSFFISPDRNVYHCFGCGKGGDIFSFVEEFEGVDFPGALKTLADKAGVKLTPTDPKKDDERKRQFAVLEEAQELFSKTLAKNKNAKEYLEKRGITSEMQERFGLGYVADEWRTLYDHFTKKGEKEEVLLKVGLIKKKEKKDGYYDTFRGRIMFPIADNAGRTIAFSGRLFPDSKKDSVAPKYLNTPETPLFNKSRILYGFEHAKRGIRKYDFAIVVEGQTDVILAHREGYTNTVAPLGTALTRDHLERIKQLTSNIILAFDADSAGMASFKRSASMALSMDFDVKVVRLPEGSDPADIISERPAEWKKLIKEATHTVDFLLAHYRETVEDERNVEKVVSREVLPFVARIGNAMDKAHFVKRIAETLSIPEEAVYTELAKVPAVEDAAPAVRETDVADSYGHNRREEAQKRILGLLMWQEGLTESLVDTVLIRERFEKLVGVDTPGLSDTELEEYAFEAELQFDTPEKLESHFDELFIALEEEILKSKLRDALSDLKRAEREDDSDKTAALLKTCQELAQKIERLKTEMQHS